MTKEEKVYQNPNKDSRQMQAETRTLKKSYQTLFLSNDTTSFYLNLNVAVGFVTVGFTIFSFVALSSIRSIRISKSG